MEKFLFFWPWFFHSYHLCCLALHVDRHIVVFFFKIWGTSKPRIWELEKKDMGVMTWHNKRKKSFNLNKIKDKDIFDKKFLSFFLLSLSFLSYPEILLKLFISVCQYIKKVEKDQNQIIIFKVEWECLTNIPYHTLLCYDNRFVLMELESPSIIDHCK